MEPKNLLQLVVPEQALTVPEFRDWIMDIEEKMLKSSHLLDHKSEDDGFRLKHTFTPGLYVREFTMPAGTMVTSRIHMHEHPFVISKGKVSVYDGESIVTYTAPYQGVTKVGTKRILFNHEETVWTTFHVTEHDTVEKMEEVGTLVCNTFEEFDRLVNKELTL